MGSSLAPRKGLKPRDSWKAHPGRVPPFMLSQGYTATHEEPGRGFPQLRLIFPTV